MNSKLLWGLMLVALGGVLLLNALHITNINLLFKGWWTLFIIVPFANKLLNSPKDWVWPFIGLTVGVLLLIDQQGWLRGYFSANVCIAIAVLLAGIVLLINSGFLKGGGKKRK